MPTLADRFDIRSKRRQLSQPAAILRQYLFDSPTRIRTRLLNGLFWTIVMTGLIQGGTIISSILTAHFLGIIEFGKFGIIYTSIITVAGFAATGLGPTTTKVISELRTTSPDRAGKLLALCSIISLITGIVYCTGLFIAAPWVADKILHAKELTSQLRIGAIYVLIFAINNYQIGALSGFEAFSRIARFSAIEGSLSIFLTLTLTWQLGLDGAVLSMVIAALISCLLYQRVLRAQCRHNNIRISYSNLKVELPNILHIALPAALSGCLGSLAVFGVNAMLVRRPGGFTQMAIFNAASSIRSVVRLIPTTLNRVSSPLLCNLLASKEYHRYKRTFWACLGMNLAFSISMSLVLYLCAYPLLRLFGKQFPDGQGVFGLLLIGAVMECLAISLYQQMYSHGRLWLQCAVSLIWSVLLLTCTWFWIENGASALAASYLVAWLSATILYAFIARKISDVTAP